MGAVAQCQTQTQCSDCHGEGAIEELDTLHGPDLDGDVKDSQALRNHKLLVAARDGNVKAMQAALEQGACTETRRPFVVAPQSAATAIEASLVSTRGTGFTPLMYAAEGGYSEACDLLLLSGACVNAEDEDGMRPLHFAALAGCPHTCKVLLQGGADRHARDDDSRIAMEVLPPNTITTQADQRFWEAVFATPAQNTKGDKLESAVQDKDRGAERANDVAR
mmetsp:Transcript_88833/g.176622  ORF Transcript_88833/g.176622 Transcript_88833/m.176622 type:complete len:221 (-) Transcript_88833:62-724(-)